MRLTAKNIYLLSWSLLSGYGIMYAVLSYCFEFLQPPSTVRLIVKGCITIGLGFTMGLLHFYFANEEVVVSNNKLIELSNTNEKLYKSIK